MMLWLGLLIASLGAAMGFAYVTSPIWAKGAFDGHPVSELLVGIGCGLVTVAGVCLICFSIAGWA